jgi:hypothetical protein
VYVLDIHVDVLSEPLSVLSKQPDTRSDGIPLSPVAVEDGGWAASGMGTMGGRSCHAPTPSPSSIHTLSATIITLSDELALDAA